MTTWDELFRTGEYPSDPDPSGILRAYAETVAGGRALDVATGTGRNAVALAETDFEVDAIDQSRAGLEIARENARARGVDDRVNWIRADVPSYEFPASTYDLVTASFYRPVDRFPDLKEALVDDGLLFVEHHLRTTDDVDSGPGGDRYRFAANELLHACLDLTVVYFDVQKQQYDDGRRAATTRIVARNSTGHHQSYPAVDPTVDAAPRQDHLLDDGNG